MENSEKLAGKLFETQTGIRLVFNDLQGEVDFLSDINCSQKVALEVTRFTNAKRMELFAKFGESSFNIESSIVGKNWLIFIQGVPNMKLLKNGLPINLQKLEIHGLDQLTISEHAWWMTNVQTLSETIAFFKKANLTSATSRIGSFKDQGETDKRLIFVSPGESWVFSGADDALKKVISWANGNLKDHKKLVKSEADERHEWVWINQESSQELINSFELPNFICPNFLVDLNPAMTDLWIVEEKSLRFFKYSRKNGWEIGNLQV